MGGSRARTSRLNTSFGSDHSVDIAVLRDSWSARTLNVPLMWTTDKVQFIFDALFHIISAIEASRYVVEEALLIADRAVELSVKILIMTFLSFTLSDAIHTARSSKMMIEYSFIDSSRISW